MDLDGAIAAHSAWKAKLIAYLWNPDKSLNLATIGLDDQCALGPWPAWRHANFHLAAPDLARRADLGEKVSEEASLGANSPYVKLSSHVVQLIVKVKQKAK